MARLIVQRVSHETHRRYCGSGGGGGVRGSGVAWRRRIAALQAAVDIAAKSVNSTSSWRRQHSLDAVAYVPNIVLLLVRRTY